MPPLGLCMVGGVVYGGREGVPRQQDPSLLRRENQNAQRHCCNARNVVAPMRCAGFPIGPTIRTTHNSRKGDMVTVQY